MAETIIPPPEVKPASDPTFVPTPVAPPPVVPTPVAPPPAAAAPAIATPTTPAPAAAPTAPKPSGLLGGVVANVQNSVAHVKAAVADIAKPAPLPNPAATVQNTDVKTAMPDAAKPVTIKSAPKTAAQTSLDVLAPVNDNIKKMLEGDDPIARIQYNQILNGTGPRNQAMLQGMGMKLANNNLDGQGAGDAMMEMMARDSGSKVEDLMANVSADSAKRLHDLNVWGFEKANQIATAAETQKRSDLSNFIATGQIGAAKSTFESLYPGMPFDEQAIKSADPARTASFNSRMKVVDQFVTQGNAEEAKNAFMSIATTYPEMFGFKDAASATAALQGVDFTSEAWQNNLAASNTASKAARVAALQGDSAGLSAAIDQKFAKMSTASIEALANSATGRPLDEINKILAASGMAPVASTDEAKMLDKAKFAKAAATYNTMVDSKKDVVDNLLDTFGKSDPAILKDPAARTAARAFLSANAYNIATNPDGSVSGYDLNKATVPPWDASSPQAPMFMDWPVASFDVNGLLKETIYPGGTHYDDNYKPGDLTTPKGQEDARLDKAYEQYVFSTPAADRLDMQKWYYATKGGNGAVDTTKLQGGLAVAPATKPVVDPMVASVGVKDKISQGLPLTPDDVILAKTQHLIPAYNSSADAARSFTGSGGTQYLNDHPDGNAFLDGKLVQLKNAYEIGDVGVSEIAYNGQKYWMDMHGQFYKSAPQANRRDNNASIRISSPLQG